MSKRPLKPARYQETKAVVQARSRPSPPPLPEFRGSKKVIQAFNGSQNNPHNKKRPITLAPTLRLTSRQRRFLKLASRDEGYCPWDPPPHAPILKNHEMRLLTDNNLVDFSDGSDAWIITSAGRAALTSQEGKST